MAETSDPILREIEDELREERLASIWKRYGTAIVAAAVGLVVVVAGYQLWSGHTAEQRLETGRQYDAASEQALSGDTDAARSAFEQLAAAGPDGYALLSRFRTAQLNAESGSLAEARTDFRAIAGDSSVDSLYRDLATLRGAYLGLDLGVDADTLRTEITPLLGETNPWRYLAQEVAALLDLQSGDSAAARAAFDALIADTAAPSGVRQRAEAIVQTLPEAGS